MRFFSHERRVVNRSYGFRQTAQLRALTAHMKVSPREALSGQCDAIRFIRETLFMALSLKKGVDPVIWNRRTLFYRLLRELKSDYKKSRDFRRS